MLFGASKLAKNWNPPVGVSPAAAPCQPAFARALGSVRSSPSKSSKNPVNCSSGIPEAGPLMTKESTSKINVSFKAAEAVGWRALLNAMSNEGSGALMLRRKS